MNDEQIKELSYDILSKLILIPRKYHYSMMEAAIKEALELEREEIASLLYATAAQENCDDAGYDDMQELADKIRKGEY